MTHHLIVGAGHRRVLSLFFALGGAAVGSQAPSDKGPSIVRPDKTCEIVITGLPRGKSAQLHFSLPTGAGVVFDSTSKDSMNTIEYKTTVNVDGRVTPKVVRVKGNETFSVVVIATLPDGQVVDRLIPADQSHSCVRGGTPRWVWVALIGGAGVAAGFAFGGGDPPPRPPIPQPMIPPPIRIGFGPPAVTAP